MLRLLADENLDGNIVRGLRRRLPAADLVRVQDILRSGLADPEVLAWAAVERRVVVTHDVATMTRFAYERVEAGFRCPVSSRSSTRQVSAWLWMSWYSSSSITTKPTWKAKSCICHFE